MAGICTEREPHLLNSPAAVYGPEPIELVGCRGLRYWVHAPFAFSGDPAVDERLSGFPVAVFQPSGRPPAETPVLLGLQGMAAPFQWNAFLVPLVLRQGIACVLFDAPMGGERSRRRRHDGDVLTEFAALVERRVPIRAGFVARVMEGVARDFQIVLRLIEERHGLTDPRRALFGVSLGVLLSAFAFLRDGVGQRLLGTVGHADLRRFARSFAPAGTRVLGAPPVWPMLNLATRFASPRTRAGAGFLRMLCELGRGRETPESGNPMAYLDRASPDRPVRFLVGTEDRLVKPADAIACANRFPDGACYVVPGMGHGGENFVGHAEYFVATQLGDWGW